MVVVYLRLTLCWLCYTAFHPHHRSHWETAQLCVFRVSKGFHIFFGLVSPAGLYKCLNCWGGTIAFLKWPTCGPTHQRPPKECWPQISVLLKPITELQSNDGQYHNILCFWINYMIPKITGFYFCTSSALDKQRFQRSSPDCCILCKVGKKWRFVICPHSQWLQSKDLHSGPQTEASEVAKKLRYCWIKLLLPLGMLRILFQFSRHFIYNSCGSQEYYSQKDFFFRSSITSGNSERDKSKYHSRLCAVVAALHT